MHNWVKYCVNRCMKSESYRANKLCDGHTDGQTDGRPALLYPPNGFAMAGDKNNNYEGKILVLDPKIPRQMSLKIVFAYTCITFHAIEIQRTVKIFCSPHPELRS